MNICDIIYSADFICMVIFCVLKTTYANNLLQCLIINDDHSFCIAVQVCGSHEQRIATDIGHFISLISQKEIIVKKVIQYYYGRNMLICVSQFDLLLHQKKILVVP